MTVMAAALLALSSSVPVVAMEGREETRPVIASAPARTAPAMSRVPANRSLHFHRAQYYGTVTCYSANNLGGVWYWIGPSLYVAQTKAMEACRLNTPSYGTCWITSCG